MARVSGDYENHTEVKNVINKLATIMEENDDIVIVNIGTDKVIWDALAPFVGTFLKERNFPHPVYGTIESPIHAVNLKERMNRIKEDHPTSTMIGIDACMGLQGQVEGEFVLRDEPLKPGRGVGKDLMPVGDYSILGIVSKYYPDPDFMDYYQGTRLDFIIKLAKVICYVLFEANKIGSYRRLKHQQIMRSINKGGLN